WRRLVFIVGGRGERFARRLFTLPEIAFVQIGDFFGTALCHAARAGVQHVTLASMVGKLAKFAAGHVLVHSRESTQDFQFLAALAQQVGATDALVSQTRQANTAQEVSELMSTAQSAAFHDGLCQAAWAHAIRLIHSAYTCEVLLLGKAGEVLGRAGTRGETADER
ncbi:MAG: cobalt-precorrin-5B (C(1))-methyltransferase, partial [Candidatus Tectomicrobia bacterium]|nr:cobalt-precorrin-5B (C(1))-methyltransferase [Candidatus Tectomicrobia bacterium]